MNEPITIFNGAHTIQNRESGQHRTFEIRTVKQGGLKGKRIVSLLTGTDNNSDYTAFGFVNDDGTIAVFQKRRGRNGQKSVWEWYAIMLHEIVVKKNPEWTDRYKCLLEGRCLVCNRLLTHPDSITRGIGPECATRSGK